MGSTGGRTAARAALAVAALISALAAGGCRSAVAHLTRASQERWNTVEVTGNKATDYFVDDEIVKRIDFGGPYPAPGVEVYASPELWAIAQPAANEFSRVFAYVRDRTGLRLSHDVRVYMIAVGATPQTVRFDLEEKGRVLEFPFFVSSDADGLSGAFAENGIAIWYIMHELSEATLAYPREGAPVLLDLAVWPLTLSNGTRWFREGVSDFSGHLAQECASRDLGVTLRPGMIADFPQLDRTGTRLFGWSNTLSEKSSDARGYTAAFSLVMLLEERSGAGAVRKIVEDLDGKRYIDGRGIDAAVKRALGLDVVAMVRNFRWPYTGLAVATPWDAAGGGEPPLVVSRVAEGSDAAAAGFREGDAVVAVDGRAVDAVTPLELALLRALPAGKALIEVERAGAPLTLTLALDVNHRPPAPKRGARGEEESYFMTQTEDIEVGHVYERGRKPAAKREGGASPPGNPQGAARQESIVHR